MGHIISGEGVHVDTEKITAITRMPRTENKGVQRILGILNYLSKFIPNFSTDTSVIRKLIKKDTVFKWEREHENAFNVIKNKLIRASVL